MGITSAILGGIGGLCAVAGILSAIDILPDIGYDALTWTFWFMLAALLLLGSIAFALGRGGGYE